MCHDARFEGGRALRVSHQSGGVDSSRDQRSAELFACFVRADDADLQPSAAQRGDIGGGVGRAAGDALARLEL
jgi:hypothetical protein